MTAIDPTILVRYWLYDQSSTTTYYMQPMYVYTTFIVLSTSPTLLPANNPTNKPKTTIRPPGLMTLFFVHVRTYVQHTYMPFVSTFRPVHSTYRTPMNRMNFARTCQQSIVFQTCAHSIIIAASRSTTCMELSHDSPWPGCSNLSSNMSLYYWWNTVIEPRYMSQS